jgi:hypothetical protein
MHITKTDELDISNTFTLSDLRSLCIRGNFYTVGTNEEYAKLFDNMSNGATLEALAHDIYIHSDGVTFNDVASALLKEHNTIQGILG